MWPAKPWRRGAIVVNAQNNAAITSNSTLVTSAVSASTGAKTTYVSNQKAGNASNTNSNLQSTTTLKFGDTVLYQATYSTANLFGTSVPKTETINPGDTVFVAPGFTGSGTPDQVYEYTGSTPETINLETENYTTGPWTAISAVEGAVYKFMGPSGTAVNLATGLLYDATSGDPITDSNSTTANKNQNYYDLGYWQQVPKAQLQASTDDKGKSTSGSASGATVGGVVVLNETHGGAYAIVTSSTVKGALLQVTANDNETISATLDATATSTAGSSFGSSSTDSSTGTTLAVNGSIAINEILGGAEAYITGSTVTTTGATSGDVDVEATNSSTITATTASATTASSSGGLAAAVGVILADNTIGADFQNLAVPHRRRHRRRGRARLPERGRHDRLYP